MSSKSTRVSAVDSCQFPAIPCKIENLAHIFIWLLAGRIITFFEYGIAD